MKVDIIDETDSNHEDEDLCRRTMIKKLKATAQAKIKRKNPNIFKAGTVN